MLFVNCSTITVRGARNQQSQAPRCHSQVQTATRYAHLAADPIKAAARSVAGTLATLLDGDAANPNIGIRRA